MFLRNYDNLFTLRNNPITLSDPSSSSVFGEGSLYLKNVSGGIQSPLPKGSLFVKFVSADNSAPTASDTEGSTCFIRWSDSTEPVDYDEYTVNFPNTSTPVSISTECEYNEIDESYITTVKQIYVAKQPLTVGSIVVTIIPSYVQNTAYPKGAKQVMLYREVLDAPIDVDTDGSFVLTFKIKRPANPNKPVEAETDVGEVIEWTSLSETKLEGSQSGYQYEYIDFVSDIVLTEEQLRNATITYKDGTSTNTFKVDDDEYATMSASGDNGGTITAIGDSNGDTYVYAVDKDNTQVNDWLFPKAGIYFSVWVDTADSNKFLRGVTKLTLTN